MDEVAFDKVAILGVGLVGGSLGLALRERGLARWVSAYSRTPATRELAVTRGAADEAADSPEACVAGAELVYLAPPVAAIVPLIEQVAPGLQPGCLVTDAGSSKAEIVAQAEALSLGEAVFVGGHPMTGSEAMGVEHARADLFVDMPYVVTPTDRTPLEAVEQVARLAGAVGSRVFRIPPGQHDRCVAAISHLPHIVAAALMLVADERHAAGEPVFDLTAGSWAAGTRVAAGGPRLWREILVSNRVAALAAMDDFTRACAHLRALIADDPDGLEATLERTRKLKLGHPAHQRP